MKKFLSILFSITLILTIFSGCSSKELEYTFDSEEISDNEIAIVSFNCAAPWGNLLDGTSSSKRVERFASYMNTIKPDSIGTQEMNSKWLDKLEKLMPDYDYYSIPRGGDDNEKKSESNAIFWDSTKYRALAVKTFWLSQTPGKESKYENAGCYRICSYVVLEDLTGQNTYVHMNTHLDNASDEARQFGMSVIIKKINEIQQEYDFPTIVLTGDFNDTIDSSPYTAITEFGFTDSRLTNTDTSIEPKSTYTDWGNIEDSGEPIDFIFSNTTSTQHKVLDDLSNGYISDHYGVYSVFELD